MVSGFLPSTFTALIFSHSILHSEEKGFQKAIKPFLDDLKAAVDAQEIVFDKKVDLACENFAIEVGVVLGK